MDLLPSPPTCFCRTAAGSDVWGHICTCTHEEEGEGRGQGQREDCTRVEGRDQSCDEGEEALCSPSVSDGCEEGVAHQGTQIDLSEGLTWRVGLGSSRNVVVVVVDNVEEVVVGVVSARAHVSSHCREQEGSEGPCGGVEVVGSWEGEGEGGAYTLTGRQVGELGMVFYLLEVQGRAQGGKEDFVGNCCCGHDAVEPIVALSSPKKQLTGLEEAVTWVSESAVTYHEVTWVVAT